VILTQPSNAACTLILSGSQKFALTLSKGGGPDVIWLHSPAHCDTVMILCCSSQAVGTLITVVLVQRADVSSSTGIGALDIKCLPFMRTNSPELVK
jgi:hypothetical protein